MDGCSPYKSQLIYLIGLMCGPHSLSHTHTHTHTHTHPGVIVILSVKQLPSFLGFALQMSMLLTFFYLLSFVI